MADAPEYVRDDEELEPAEDPSEREFRANLSALIVSACEYIDNEISPARATASEYFHGEELGNEEEGRSKVVITEVRDTIRGIVPSVLRVVFGPDRVVEFRARTAEDEPVAAQANEYIPFVFEEEQSGFLKCHDLLIDGMVKKLGAVRWYWDAEEPKAYELEGVTQTQLLQLEADDANEIHEITQTKEGAPAPEGGVAVEAEFSVKLTRHDREGRPAFVVIPPEEVVYNREARTLQDAKIVAHRTEKTRGELIALGIDEELIDEWGHKDTSLDNNPEELERREVEGNVAGVGEDLDSDEANTDILYIESFVRLDGDGDGIAELRRVCTIGPSHYPVNGPFGEPADEVPFAFFCPVPEPHTLTGQSYADLTMDLQRIKSNLVRGTLDSLSLSLFPRAGVVEGQVSMADVLNTEIGAPIRMRAPGMYQPFEVPFMGKEALPVLAYFDDVAERRTGQNKGAMGLDADALQSSTKAAVGAAVTASQEQKELLVRLFCEQLLKPLFRGLYRLVVKHKPRQKIIRLTNNWVPIDPATWNADMDVRVNVALGSALTEQKIETLMGIAAKMELIFGVMGLDNPLCGPAEYRNTLTKAIELQGWKDTEQFFRRVDPNWKPAAPAQPMPTPEQVIAQAQLQIEQMRTVKELEIKQAELALKQQQFDLESQLKLREQEQAHELELRKLAAEIELRRFEIQAKYQYQLTELQLEQATKAQEQYLEEGRVTRELEHREEVAAHEAALKQQEQEHRQELERDRHEHDKAMAERQAAAAERAAETAGSEKGE